MTFLRLGISSFFIIAPAIAYFASMDSTVVVALLIPALWGFISAAGEGALGLHHMDAYGPLSSYNDESDGQLTSLGKISAAVVAVLGALLLFFAASSYIKNKNKLPEPIATSTPVASPTADAPVSTPSPVATKEPVVVPTPKATKTPDVKKTPEPKATEAPVDIKFEKLKIKAEDTVLSRNYKGAQVILDDLEKQAPNDVDVLFFRFLAHQGLDEDDKAKEYADKILKEHPRSRYERRLSKFLDGLELAKKRKKLGGHFSSNFAIPKGEAIALEGGAKLAVAGSPNIDEVTGSQIGLELTLPDPEVKPINLEAGATVVPKKSVHFYLNTGSGELAWERSRDTRGSAELDMVFVKVASGKHKGKQGWLANSLKGVSSSEDKPAANVNNILGLQAIR